MADRTVRVRLQAITTQYEQAMQQAGRKTKELGQGVMKHARENEAAYTSVGMAATAMGAASALALRSVVSAGGEYQASMNQVRAVSGATGDTFNAMSAQARELGASTKFSAGEAADAMYFLSSAGFSADEVMSALPGTLELAAAGNMDLAQAADIASNVLSGYGMTADDIGRVNDVMAVTFTNTNTNIAQMGEAMQYVAPVANAAGVQFEEAAAAIGLMGNAGIQASTAGTSLRGIITRLLTPTDEAAGLLEKLGVNAVDSSGNLNSLESIVEQLGDSGATTGELMTIFGQRAGPAMAALLSQGADALRDQTEAGLESAGTAADIAGIQMEGFQGAMVELKSAVEGLKIALFESGIGTFAEMTVDALTSVVRIVEGMPEPVHNAAMSLLAAASAVGLLGGATLLLLPRIAATSAAMGTLGLSMSAILGPLALVTAAITIGTVFYGRYAEAKAEAARRSTEMADALELEAEGHEGVTRALTVEELAKAGLTSRMRDYGITVDEVIASINGEAGARERLGAKVMAQIERDREAGESTKRHTDFMRDMAPILGGLADGHAELADRLRIEAELRNDANQEWVDAADIGERNTRVLHLLRGSVEDVSGEVAEITPQFVDMGEGMDEAAESSEKLSRMMEAHKKVVESLGAPLAIYQEALKEKNDKEREAYEVTAKAMQDSDQEVAAFSESAQLSLGEYADAVQQRNDDIINANANFLTVTRLFGADVATILMEMGEEGVAIAGDMAEGVDENSLRLAQALRDNAALARSWTLDEMHVIAEGMESILADGGTASANALARELGIGVQAVLEIAHAYGIALAEGLNPVIKSIGGEQIAVSQRVANLDAIMPGFIEANYRHEGGPVDGSPGSRLGRSGPLRSDEVPIVAKRNEWVINDRAVAKYGPGFMSKLNRGELIEGADHDGGGFSSRGFGGVRPHVARTGNYIKSKYGVRDIGGIGQRKNASDHPKGLALDFMTYNNVALGNRIVGELQRNAAHHAIKYLIWQQAINTGSGWRRMADRGNPTANHMDHPHVSFLGGPGGGRGMSGEGANFGITIDLPKPPNFPNNGIGGSAPAAAAHTYNAANSWLNTGVYDQGGVLRPGWTLAYNGTGQDERVMTGQQIQQSGGGTTINATINMPPGSDGNDVVRALKRWERDNGPVPVRTA